MEGRKQFSLAIRTHPLLHLRLLLVLANCPHHYKIGTPQVMYLDHLLPKGPMGFSYRPTVVDPIEPSVPVHALLQAFLDTVQIIL